MSSMAITMYSHPLAPGAGSVLLAVKALGVEHLVTQEEVDLSTETPLHLFPYIDHDGFRLSNSQAIVTYLASAYGKSDSLYPKDPKKRAKVDQWLHFSSAILYNRLVDMTEPLLTKMSKVVSEEKSERAETAFKMIQDELCSGPSGPTGPWLCGEDMTLADLCCVSLVAAIEIFIGDSNHYPKVSAWMGHCKKHMPGYQDVVEAYRQRYVAIIASRMTS